MLSVFPHLASAILLLASPVSVPADSPAREPQIAAFIDWFLTDGQKLEAVPFSEVVKTATGNRVLPADPSDPETARAIRAIETAARAVLDTLNDFEHPVHSVGRINEVSGHVEVLLRKKLDGIDDFRCEFPVAENGRTQRAGYPDLRLVDETSGRVFYVDPKLYADGSERSSFRTFYFEPKIETNKIRDDAVHLVLGIAHGGRIDGSWRFLRWRLVDLSGFSVRLKAEFQAGNRDLYRPESVVSEGTFSGKNRKTEND